MQLVDGRDMPDSACIVSVFPLLLVCCTVCCVRLSGDISSTDGSMQQPNSSSNSSSGQQEPPGQHTVWIPEALQAAPSGSGAAPVAAWREEAATARA
jgi:hypothetical protein